MEIVLLVATITFFVLVFLCIRKEKDLIGFYKQIKVCGRWYAFFTADFLFAGVVGLIGVPVVIILNLMGMLDDVAAEMGGFIVILAIFALAAIIFLPIGILLYRHASKKCPAELKRRLLLDMFIIMLGTSFRFAFFFLMFLIKTWWHMNKPTAYEVDGRIVYAYPGSNDLYDADGWRVGEANSDRTKARMN